MLRIGGREGSIRDPLKKPLEIKNSPTACDFKAETWGSEGEATQDVYASLSAWISHFLGFLSLFCFFLYKLYRIPEFHPKMVDFTGFPLRL